jgi:tagatose-6-phosphate ketose/aldose isomerase
LLLSNQQRGRTREHAEAGLESALVGTVGDWLRLLTERGGEIGALLAVPADEQQRRGYAHTLREICQQPVTWLETATRATDSVPALASALAHVQAEGRAGAILLTGSGSSEYAGECLALGLQRALGLPTQAVSAGVLLTHPSGCLPAKIPGLVVSFARSGNSPESCAAVDSVRETAPGCRHLVITCNGQGKLATRYRDDPRVTILVLDDKTNDRSLVMTSSFTNMVLAGRLLAMAGDLDGFRRRAEGLARAGAEILLRHADGLARMANSGYQSAVYLGSGCRYGSAREAGLKMLEMTGGRVKTVAETYLGLRHGPMCAIDDGALVVCFLSSDATIRAYEMDLVRELSRKQLGARKVIFGHEVPADMAGEEDLLVDARALGGLHDEDVPIVDVVVGQLLAFFACLGMGLHPDSPSDGVISRVVEDFAIHHRS